MDALEDIGKELEKNFETMSAQEDGMGFDQASTLVGDLFQRAYNEVDA